MQKNMATTPENLQLDLKQKEQPGEERQNNIIIKLQVGGIYN